MSDVIKDPKMKKFVESNISNSFGLSVNQVAEKCKNWGRFKEWLNSDVIKIREVLNKVKSNGVSPAFFASYEKSEGYNSKWGWLNHTKINGTPLNDADSVSKWIVSQSKNTTDNPAWIDYANYKDFVPASVKKAGNEHFKTMKSGSIGKVIIAGTAAATWAVYYPLGLKKEYNGVQDYADPITVMYKTIEEWGGSLDGKDPSPDPDPEPEPEPEPEIDFSGITKFFENFSKDFVNKIKKMMVVSLFDYGKSNTFGNSFLRVDKTFSNTYKIKPTLNFNSEIDKIIKKGADNLKDIIGSIKPNPNPDPDPDPEPDPEPDPSGEPIVPMSKKNLWITSEYGERSSGFHWGIDLGVSGNPVNTEDVFATMSGTVKESNGGCSSNPNPSCNGGAGNYVTIEHDDGYYSRYLHLGENSITVKVGDKVKQGQVIGKMANSGNSFGAHLHFEISPVYPVHRKQINPREYVKGLKDIPKT